MKRLAAIILSALILFSFTACDFLCDNETPDTSETTQIKPPTEENKFSPPSWNAPLFFSYDDIRYAIIKLEKYGGIESFENSGIKLDSREQEIYDALRSIIGQPLAYSCHDDINSDGIDELIIMTNTHGSPRTPIVAFGIKDGKPILLRDVVLDRSEIESSPQDITQWNGDYYKIFSYKHNYTPKDQLEYEIYDKNGKLVRCEKTNSTIHILRSGDIIQIEITSADIDDHYNYRQIYYSISENKFSDTFFDAWDFYRDKVVYPDENGVLTVQNIFDKSVFFKQYPEYKNPFSVNFDSDGKSISFECYVENQRKMAIKTICLERLPIIKVLYNSIPVFYSEAPYDHIQLTSLQTKEWAYLRSATSDIVRLLDTEPIKINWNGETLMYYKVLYFDREYYIYANDLIEVTYYGDDGSHSLKTKEEVISSVVASLPELKDRNFYAEDVYTGYNFTTPQKGYFFSFAPADGFYVQLEVFLKTDDGGNSWQPITVAKPPVLNWKERILCAKMINDNVGLISGRYYAGDDGVSDRTYITTDGGLNWEKVELPTHSRLLDAEVYDFVRENGEYYLCLRVLTGDSYENYRYEHFEYSSRDLKNWSIVAGGK